MHYLVLDTTGEQIPVNKILCLGKNYERHAREMGSTETADPIVFLKPSSAILHSGGRIILPTLSRDVHHELELVVVIGSTARDVPEEEALDHVLGYAIGLDMTMRDVQAQAKKRGEPWTISKGFDTSAPISMVVPKFRVRDPQELMLSLRVNGEFRQTGSTADMIWSVPRIISYLSGIFTLERGDCIFTGTPEGVARVNVGDIMRAEIEGVVSLQVSVVAKELVAEPA